MPDLSTDWLTTIKPRAKGVLAALGTTSVTVLAAVVLGLMLRDYADDAGVPALLDEVRQEYKLKREENEMRLLALRTLQGIRWNATTLAWEALP